MSNIKISNKIFSLGLTLKELAIYTYLSSIHADSKKVSMHRIAAACGFKTTEAVSRNIFSLLRKGMIISITSTVKADNMCGSNMYVLKELSLDNGFFFFPRKLFKMGLSYKELAVLLFQYKAYSPERGISWNSYNDMARTLKMKRSDVIMIINQLVQKELLRKRLFRSQSNRNVFTDNHYTVFWFGIGMIRRGLKAKSKRAHPLQLGKPSKVNSYHLYDTSFYEICQYIDGEISEKNAIFNTIKAALNNGGGTIRDFAALLTNLCKSDEELL